MIALRATFGCFEVPVRGTRLPRETEDRIIVGAGKNIAAPDGVNTFPKLSLQEQNIPLYASLRKPNCKAPGNVLGNMCRSPSIRECDNKESLLCY
jgi:hypothetical protein